MSRQPQRPPQASSTPATPAGAPARKGSFWRTVRAVGWGFFGVRKNSGFQEDIARLTPLHIMVVGIVGVILFVVALVLFVKFAVAP